MKPHGPVLLLTSFLCAGATAQVDTARSRRVLAAEDQRFTAMCHADTAALGRLLAADLTYTHTDGEQNTKDDFLRLLTSGALRYDSIAPEGRQVRVFESTAIVTGRSAMQVESGGHAASFRIRYLAVYRFADGRWELVAWQSTRLPE
jgi:ketosteroid isomerase-like protein